MLLSPDGVWYLYMVGPPPVASSTALARTNRKTPPAHVDQQHPGQRLALPVRDQGQRAVFFQAFDRRGQHLLHQPVDDFDPRQVALVHRVVESLAGKGLVMQRPVRVAVKETADLVLQLPHPDHRGLAEPPGHLLVRQPLAAGDGIHEMTFDGIAGRQGHVVAALDHARAAAFSPSAP